jgi:poly(A) polymerase/tRNA nucleotidyltransferase (CCA-adding enzyme)
LKIYQELQQNKLLHDVIAVLQDSGIEAYLVGGPVRDLLLGRSKIVDYDFAVPEHGVAAARRVANALGAAFYVLDSERDTGRAVCEVEGDSGPTQLYLDFAAFRGPTLAADLADRDFTVNAIALSLTDTPQLIDPLQGRRDLEAGRIRATSPHIFRNDPVRILRAIRLAIQFGFAVEPETEKYLSRSATLLTTTSPERQRDELIKLLNTPNPGTALQSLHRLAVLPHFLPEVEAMAGVAQSPPHYLDVLDHTAAALDFWVELRKTQWACLAANMPSRVERQLNEPIAGNLTQGILTPMALLLHDTGKPLTRCNEVINGQPRVRFIGHERAGAKLARGLMNRLRFSRQAAEFVETVVANHMRPFLLAAGRRVTRRATYRFFRDTRGATFQAGIAVAGHALADQRATYPEGQGQAEKHALINIVNQLMVAFFDQQDQVIDPPPLLSGRDIIEALGISEGQLVGVLLSRLIEAQAANQVTDKAAALDFIKADPDFANYRKDDL